MFSQLPNSRKFLLGALAVLMLAGIIVVTVIARKPSDQSASEPQSAPARPSSTPSSPLVLNPSDVEGRPVGAAEPADWKPVSPSSQTNTEAKTSTRANRQHPAPAQDRQILDLRPLPTSLPTGTRITADTKTQGRGILTLRNGNGIDAVVRVVDQSSGGTVRWVYVRSRDGVTLTGVEPGSYGLLVTLGLDWDDENMRFRQRPTYERVDKIFDFSEREESDGIVYDRRTIVLNPVNNGNLPYHHISEAEFREGLTRRPLER